MFGPHLPHVENGDNETHLRGLLLGSNGPKKVCFNVLHRLKCHQMGGGAFSLKGTTLRCWLMAWAFRLPGFKYWRLHLVAVKPWASYLASLGLSFTICKVGTRSVLMGHYRKCLVTTTITVSTALLLRPDCGLREQDQVCPVHCTPLSTLAR